MLQEFFQDPVLALTIIGNLVLIETLLSIDNAAVLATMVMDLPEKQRGQALRYGIIGAYVFRGLALISASWLIEVSWLKPVGGLYLVWLAGKYFYTLLTPQTTDDVLNKSEKPMYKKLTGLISPFWSTVIFVEIMDIAFSVDNVFAAVAFTDKLLLIYIGVFIGIIAMRFVALGFVKLIDKYKFLQTSAFLVVFLLGLKLVCSNYIPKTFAGHDTDLLISLFTLIIFFLPMIIFMTKPRGNKS